MDGMRKMSSQQKKAKVPAQRKPKNKAKKQVNAPMAPTTRVSVPAASGQVLRNRKPKIKTAKNGRDIVVSHREYIGTVVGAVDYAVVSYPVNPGMPQTFPWLSQMAPLYESYKFESLKFEYSQATSSATTGTVAMGVDYDASDPAPTSEDALLNWEQAISSAPWWDFKCVSLKEEISKRNTYYVRDGSLSANSDVKLYDTGNLFVATFGMAGATKVGNLFVEYKVRLMTPQLNQPGLGQARYAKFSAVTANGAVTKTGNAPIDSGNLTANDTLTLTATAPYQGLVSLLVVGTALAAPTSTAGSTATVTLVAGTVNTAATQMQTDYLVNFVRAGQTMVMDVNAGTFSAITCRLGQYASANA